MLTDDTVRTLLDLERDCCQLDAALSDMLARLRRLPVRQARAVARDVRRLRTMARRAFARLDTPIAEAAALAEYLEAAPF